MAGRSPAIPIFAPSFAPSFALKPPKKRSRPAHDGTSRLISGHRIRLSGPERNMLSRILTVGGLTLVSRVTGFLRDIVLAALLGAGPVADAFFVALRLPNHFRAIFAEGAFNAAFVPAYARVRSQGGRDPAALFADRVFTLLFASEVVLLAIALIFT